MLAWSLVVVFCGSTCAVFAGWLVCRGVSSKRAAWERSLKFSTAAVVPAIFLLVECALHLVHHWLVPGAGVPPHDFLGVMPSLLWILIGPVLFLKAFALRVPDVPQRVFALQLTQLVSWASSSLVALWFAAMV